MSSDTFISGAFSLGLLYWAVLIGSSLWAAAVRYVSDGDKDCNSLSLYLMCTVAEYDLYEYGLKEYKSIETGGFWFSNLIFTFIYGLVTAALAVLVEDGHGTLILIVMSTIATIVALLRISKFIYKIGKKLNMHVDDKNAHSK